MPEVNLPIPQIGKDDSETIQNLFDTVIKLRKELEFLLYNLDSSNVKESLRAKTAVIGQLEAETIEAENITTVNGKITTAQIENLVVGNNVTMGANAVIEWEVIDGKPDTTYIDSNGIYTGTLIAQQINSIQGITLGSNASISWEDLPDLPTVEQLGARPYDWVPAYGDISGTKPPTDADNTTSVIGATRLTHIDQYGIYTGTLTAEQINVIQGIVLGANATIQWANLSSLPSAGQIGARASDWIPAKNELGSWTTYIDAYGIYTGTINADNINAGTLRTEDWDGDGTNFIALQRQMMFFQEDEATKMAIGFLPDKDNVLTPLLVLGAGDGYGNNRGYISKSSTSLDLYYMGNLASQEVSGIRLKKDGIETTHPITVYAGLANEFVINAENWNNKLTEIDMTAILTDPNKGLDIPANNLDASTRQKVLNGDEAYYYFELGQLHTDRLADSVITTGKLANSAVNALKLADLSVIASKIADSAITFDKIADGAVNTQKLADASITTAKIANASVDVNKLANLAVTASKISDGSITFAKLGDASVGSQKIQAEAVTGTKIALASIGTAHIETGAITNALIANASIDTAKIADATITSVKIQNGAVGSLAIANTAIGTAHIANGAIVTAHIQNASITSALIANLAVGSSAIQSSAIGTAHIANGVITNAHIQDATITSAKIQSLTADKITAGTLTGFTIQTASSGNRLIMQSSGFYGIDSDDNYHGIRLSPSTAELGLYENGTEFFRVFKNSGATKFTAYNNEFLGYNQSQEKLYPLGIWDFSSCTVLGLTGGGGWSGGDIDIGGLTKSHIDEEGQTVDDTTAIFGISSEFIPWSDDTKLMVQSQHATQEYTILEIMSPDNAVTAREATVAVHVVEGSNDYFGDFSMMTYQDDPRMVMVAQSRGAVPPWWGVLISTNYFNEGGATILEGFRFTRTGEAKGETHWQRKSNTHINMIRLGDYSSMVERLAAADSNYASYRRLAIMYNAFCSDYTNNLYQQYTPWVDSYKLEFDGTTVDNSAGGGFKFFARPTLDWGKYEHNESEWVLCMNVHKNGIAFGSGDFYLSHGYGTENLYIGKASKTTKFLGNVDFSTAQSVSGFTAVWG